MLPEQYIYVIVLAPIIIFFSFLLICRHYARNGKYMSFSKFRIRRWYCPGKLQPDNVILGIQQRLRNVSEKSIGSIINYPAIIADTVESRRKEFSNKLILEVYVKDELVGFHMAFISSYPHVHLGLIMVDDAHRGKGIQKLSSINIFFLALDWWCTGFYISDLGYSSSGWRMFSEVISDVHPNLYYKTSCKPYHKEIAKLMLDKYRPDAGISSLAVFDEETFVIVKSNQKEGGGASVLIPFTSTRVSKRSSIAQRILEELLEPEDEQIYVGYASLFWSFQRLFPIVSGLLTFRWILLISLILYHTFLVPNLRWYYYAGFKLTGFEVLFPSGRTKLPTKPCIWICNHFSFIDMWAMKVLNPEVYLLAKKDLIEEAPEGWIKEGFKAAFEKCLFLWYDRANKDTDIRDRMKHILQVEKRPICVFAEGTSQRNGPPMRMYDGSLLIAQECHVPIQPICIRYNVPIGLEKEDNAHQSALQLIRLTGKSLSIHPLPELLPTKDTTIDDIRTLITGAYHEAAETLHIPSRARGGKRNRL